MPQLPTVQWIEPAQNPWKVRVLDVRPVTQTMISSSQDPECAANALSYGRDSGAGFLGTEPAVNRTAGISLRYRVERPLADGALFVPTVMEHKWAIFCHQGKILVVRSWLRKVFVVAEFEQAGDLIEVKRLNGVFADENEPLEFSRWALDYLIRSHALGLIYPAPLFPALEGDPQSAALWCFSAFGNMAHFAATEEPKAGLPDQPLEARS